MKMVLPAINVLCVNICTFIIYINRINGQDVTQHSNSVFQFINIRSPSH